MSKIPYIEKNFRQDSLDLIYTANDIIEDYQERGKLAAGPLVLWTAGVLRPKGPVGMQEEE